MILKKILVPLDFSANSINALKYAAALARSQDAGIFIHHIPNDDDNGKMLHDNITPEHMFDLIRNESYMKGLKLSFSTGKGNIPDSIIKEARVSDIDLIVMGTQGAGNFTKSIIGTNTSRIIGNTDCPVLAVPAEATYVPVKKVVIAVDLDNFEQKIISELVDYFKILGTSILLTYVSKENVDENEVTLNRIANELQVSAEYEKIACKVIDSDDFLEGLENYVLSIDADLIAMITHHRSLLESVFDPSITKRFSYHLNVPLFVVSQKRVPVIFLGVPI